MLQLLNEGTSPWDWRHALVIVIKNTPLIDSGATTALVGFQYYFELVYMDDFVDRDESINAWQLHSNCSRFAHQI